MPCADAENSIGNKASSVYNETNSSSNEHYDDSCSPFCICNCCHFNGFYKTHEYVTNTTALKIDTDKNTIEYTSTLFSNFHNSIWQPPQIS
jgi:hypothetical protein